MGRATEVHSRRHLRRSPLLHEEKFLSPADRTLFILFITGAGTPLSGTSRALLLRLSRGRSPPRGEGGSPEPPSPLSHERKFPSPTRTPPSSPQGAREALRNFPRPFRTKENFSKSFGPLFFSILEALDEFWSSGISSKGKKFIWCRRSEWKNK